MVFIIGGAYQGKTDYAREHFKEDCTVVNQYHLRVREQLRAGLDPMQEAKKMLSSEKGELVIISDEIGCGLVPVDVFEREYREKSGRVNCYFAKEADQVIRVVCGIGSRIK